MPWIASSPAAASAAAETSSLPGPVPPTTSTISDLLARRVSASADRLRSIVPRSSTVPPSRSVNVHSIGPLLSVAPARGTPTSTISTRGRRTTGSRAKPAAAKIPDVTSPYHGARRHQNFARLNHRTQAVNIAPRSPGFDKGNVPAPSGSPCSIGTTASVPPGNASPADNSISGRLSGLYELAPTVCSAATANPSSAAESQAGIGLSARISRVRTRPIASRSGASSFSRGLNGGVDPGKSRVERTQSDAMRPAHLSRSARMLPQIDDLDPVGLLAHRILLEAGQRTRLRVDPVNRHRIRVEPG